jgi:hypothetical protein
MVALTGQDVVRHKLVQRIVDAYGASEDHRAYRQAVEEALAEDPGAVGGGPAGGAGAAGAAV